MSNSYVALIIDNNANARKILASVIRQQFSMRDIFTSSSGREAMAVIRQSDNIDWVICNSELEDKDCFELIEEAKKQKSTKNAKFVLTSSNSDRSILLKAASCGVNSFILKPFTPKTIYAKMQKLVDGKSQRKSKRIELLEAIEARVQFAEAKYKSVLVDVSLGGCMIKSGLFNKGGLIYDNAKIQIPLDKESISVEAQLIRMERDMSSEKKLICSAFIFTNVSKSNAARLTDFLSKIKNPKL